MNQASFAALRLKYGVMLAQVKRVTTVLGTLQRQLPWLVISGTLASNNGCVPVLA